MKVEVTVGGDHVAELAPAPLVAVTEVAVPDLLDRTEPQAKRILRDSGLVMKREEGKRGPAGRVVDQMPAAGGRIPKGGVVRVWVAPGDPNALPATPPGPTETPGETQPTPSQPPLDPGPLPGGVPKPLSPGPGTELPKGETVPVGFTWRGVKGAQAYIVEVEEEGAEGRWLASARKPSRKTAALLEIERLGQGRLRWRVRAVIGGKQGTAAKWVVIR